MLTVFRPVRAVARLALWWAFAIGAAVAGPRDYVTLLVPDGADQGSWPIKVWTDTAAEEGVQMVTMTASNFLALGPFASYMVDGLILPDSAHMTVSDALVAAVRQYVQQGGKLMLTYDAGVLNEADQYDPSGRSRFSELVGVDYVLYDSLRERMVGFGPVVGSRGRLDNLGVPPGKYLPYAAPAQPAALAAYVPASRLDPGGSAFMRSRIRARARLAPSGTQPALSTVEGLRYEQPVTASTAVVAQQQVQAQGAATLRADDDASAPVADPGAEWPEAAPAAPVESPRDRSLQVVSGYGFGQLDYYHFVTSGSFPGTVFLSSPTSGLVAGERSYGAGKVLFVNLPLGFFKAIGTDGMLLHGFLTHFARDQVVMPRLSAQPRGVGGLVYNWHVDDGDDVVPQFRQLLDMPFLRNANAGPFSVHFTAGPDVSVLGDGQGMNLPANPAAQDVLRRAGKFAPYAGSAGPRHEIASHGGWNHNLYGTYANEDNAATYLPWLELNFAAVENVTGRTQREYSAPQGNNPGWAVRWLEARGVVGMYTVSNTGSAATREWRDGSRLTDRLWTMPITPFGVSATFEEFAFNGVSDAATAQWLSDLQSFVVNHRTNRLFYNHPPGALEHVGVVRSFVNRAGRLQDRGRFKWYTMTELADFAQRRIQTTWHSSSAYGVASFAAANPQSLADVTWLLPRSRYGQPTVTAGSAQVSGSARYWLVTGSGGQSLRFSAPER